MNPWSKVRTRGLGCRLAVAVSGELGAAAQLIDEERLQVYTKLGVGSRRELGQALAT